MKKVLNYKFKNYIVKQMIELLYFSCWIETRYQKSGMLSIKLGKRTPTFVKNYFPGTKIHMFDTVNPSQLPKIQIIFDQCQQKTFVLADYKGHQNEPHVQIMEDCRILFTFQLLKDTQKLYDKYCQQKSQVEKHFLCEGIKDFVRSEQQFLAQYERNQQIEEIRILQAEESRIQRDLCDQIMNTKKYSLSIGKIILVVIFFLFVGFIIGRHDHSIKGNFIINKILNPIGGGRTQVNRNNKSKHQEKDKQKQKIKIQDEIKNKKVSKYSKSQKSKI